MNSYRLAPGHDGPAVDDAVEKRHEHLNKDVLDQITELSINIPNDYVFSDDNARDAYFTTHPDELHDGLFIISNGFLETRLNGAWQNASSAVQGPKGDKGDMGDTGGKGDTGDTGPQGPQGNPGDTPTIVNGTWSISGVDTGLPATQEVKSFVTTGNGTTRAFPMTDQATASFYVLIRETDQSVYFVTQGDYTTTNKTLTLNTAPGNGAQIFLLYAVGNNGLLPSFVSREDLGEFVLKTGDTMTGPLVAAGDAVQPMQYVPLRQVQELVASGAVEPGNLFRGFIGSTAPTTDMREGNFWYQSSVTDSIPTTFPWPVHTYTSGAWTTGTTDYTPMFMDVWVNYNVNPSTTWMYEGDHWGQLDFNGTVFDSAYFELVDGKLTLKQGSISDSSIAANAAIAQAKIDGLVDALTSIQNELSTLTGSVSYLGTSRVNKAGDTMTGTLVAKPTSSLTTAQVLNSIISTSDIQDGVTNIGAGVAYYVID